MKTTAAKEYVTAKWDQWASKYDDQYAHGIKSEEERRAWRSLLERVLGSPPKKVLDVGTGTGFLAFLCAGIGHSCLGLDLSEEMLKRAREKAVEYSGNIAFACGDAEDLILPDGVFDAVINRHLLWTLPNPEKALVEWRRVLKPGGKVVVINAVWSTFGFFNKLQSLLGNMLIAVTEFRNPWAGGYKKDVVPDMPLFTRVRPDKIKEMLESAGYKNVEFIDMKDVYAAEYNAMPWRYRLAYRHERYAVSAVKP